MLRRSSSSTKNKDCLGKQHIQEVCYELSYRNSTKSQTEHC